MSVDRKKLKRFLFGCVAALIMLLLTEAYLYVTSPAFGQFVAQKIAVEFKKQGVDFTAQFLSFSIFAPNARAEKVGFRSKNNLMATVKELSVDLEPFQKDFVPTRFRSVKINGVSIAAQLPKDDGTKKDDKDKDKKKSDIEGIDLDFNDLPMGLYFQSLVIKNMSFMLLDSDARLIFSVNDCEINLNYNKSAGQYQLSVFVGSGKARLPETDNIIEEVNNVRFSMTLKDRSVKLHEFAFKMLGGEYKIAANFPDLRSLKGYIDFRVDTDIAEAYDRYPQYVPNSYGRLTAEGMISGSLKNPSFKGTVEIADARIMPQKNIIFAVEKAKIPLIATKKKVSIINASVWVGEKESIFIHDAEIGLDGEIPVNAKLELKGAPLENILEDLTLKGAFVKLDVFGKIDVKGSLNPFSLKGSANLSPQNLYVYSHAYNHPKKKNDHILTVPSADVTVDIEINKDRVRLTNGIVTRNESLVKVVRNDFNFDGTLYLEYMSPRMKLTDPGKIVGLSFDGTGSLRCAISIASAVVIKASSEFEDFSINGIPIGRVKSKVEFAGDVLSFADINLADLKGGKAQANLRFDFRRDMRIVSDFYAEGMELNKIITALKIKDAAGFKGKLYAAGEISGAPGKMSGSITGNITNVSAFGLNVPALHVDVSVIDQKKVAVNALDAVFKKGSISVSGEIAEDEKLDFKIKSKELRIESVDSIKDYLSKLTGEAELQAEIGGTVKSPKIKGSLFMPSPFFDKRPLEPLDVAFAYSEDVFTASSSVSNKRLAASATADFKERKLHADFALADFEINKLLKPLADKEIEGGALTGSGSVTAPFDNFAKAAGSFKIDGGWVSVMGLRLEIKNAEPALLGGGKIEIKQISAEGPYDSRITLKGTADSDGTYDFLIAGGANAKIAAKLLKAKKWQTQGELEFKISISGSAKTPMIADGMARAKNGTFLMPGAPKIENIEAAALISGRKIIVDSMKGTISEGTMSLSGEIALDDDMAIKKWALELSMQKLAVPLTDKLKPVFNAQLSLEGSKFPLLLKGDVKILDMSYTANIPWEMRLFENISKIFSPPRKSKLVTAMEEPVLNFDVNVYGKETIKIYNNLAQLNFTSELKLVGDNLSPGLLGSLSAYKGIIKFQTKDFNVSSFIVTFKDQNKIYPEFEVNAVTDQLDYKCGTNEGRTKITARISGNEDEYQLDYSSDASDLVDKTQVWSVLIAGDCGMRQETFESEMKNLVGGILTNPIEKSFGVETRIVFEPMTSATGTTKVVPHFTIGKALTPNLTALYSSTFAEDEGDDRKLQLKFHSKDFSIYGAWSSGNTQKQGGLGLDFVYQYEF